MSVGSWTCASTSANLTYCTALPRLSREERQLLQDLYISDYEGHKKRNPERTAGTCEWVFDHPDYISWESKNTSRLLWVSADPGCGKSVLASFLIDRFKSSGFQNVMPSTICYFFFKDDNQEQNNAISAISSLLHQLLAATPKLMKHALEPYKFKGKRLFDELHSLWQILLSAATDATSKQVICIIDGLDECQNASQSKFLQLLSEFCTESSRPCRERAQLKILLFSRPYITIEDALFHPLTIRMKMEDESGLTGADIEMVIRNKVSTFGSKRNVSNRGQQQLIDRLISSAGQTFLWVSLVLADLESSLQTSETKLEELVDQVPANLYAAYKKILGKSKNPKDAQKILYIILGAVRPLSIEEMNIAFVIKPEDRSYDGLSLEPAIVITIRNLCGLFVKVIDSKIYLVHQTARKFLIDVMNSRVEDFDIWQNPLGPLEADNVLAQTCVSYLMLKDFEEQPLITSAELDDKETIRQYLDKHDFLHYAAKSWVFHFRKIQSRASSFTIESVLHLLITQSERFQTWITIFTEQPSYRHFNTKDATSLSIASYWGFETIVKLLLNNGAAINARSARGFFHQTSLMIAIEKKRDAVTRLLLENGADFGLTSPRTGTALTLAAQIGNESIVKLLLEKDANPNKQTRFDKAPLQGAAKGGHMSVVKVLIDKGAQVNAIGLDSHTALHWAVINGHDSVVQLLLENSAFPDIQNYKGNTALHIPFEKLDYHASEKKHGQVFKLLMEHGANPQIQNEAGDTALHLAIENGLESVSKVLAESRANNDIQDRHGNTVLHLAVMRWSKLKVNLRIEERTSSNSHNSSENTALHAAVQNGYESLVKLLVNHVNVDVQNEWGDTALHDGVRHGTDFVVELLLQNGARHDIIDEHGYTPLACANMYRASAAALLRRYGAER